jgi:hypothetical protein
MQLSVAEEGWGHWGDWMGIGAKGPTQARHRALRLISSAWTRFSPLFCSLSSRYWYFDHRWAPPSQARAEPEHLSLPFSSLCCFVNWPSTSPTLMRQSAAQAPTAARCSHARARGALRIAAPLLRRFMILLLLLCLFFLQHFGPFDDS